MFASRTRMLFASGALALAALPVSLASAQAAPAAKAPPAAAPAAAKAAAAAPAAAKAAAPAPAAASDVKVPETVAEHEARGKAYKEQAAGYRKSAEEHKQMAAAYAAKRPDMKGVGKNPSAEKMSKHCGMLAKDFEKLATDADKMGEFHMMRAKELQGG